MNCYSDSCLTSTKWKWNTSSGDWDIYAHVFDQNDKNSGIPYRYPTAKASPNNDSWLASLPSNAVCSSDYSITPGDTLYSGAKIENQISCNPDPYNAGNWYSFPAATAGSKMDSEINYPSDAKNSICPKGWQLPPNTGDKSYNDLIRSPSAYNISDTDSDTKILETPLSFVRLGNYAYNYGSLYSRGGGGRYWSSTAHSSVIGYILSFDHGYLNPQNGGSRAQGFSIRCISR